MPGRSCVGIAAAAYTPYPPKVATFVFLDGATATETAPNGPLQWVRSDGSNGTLVTPANGASRIAPQQNGMHTVDLKDGTVLSTASWTGLPTAQFTVFAVVRADALVTAYGAYPVGAYTGTTNTSGHTVLTAGSVTLKLPFAGTSPALLDPAKGPIDRLFFDRWRTVCFVNGTGYGVLVDAVFVQKSSALTTHRLLSLTPWVGGGTGLPTVMSAGTLSLGGRPSALEYAELRLYGSALSVSEINWLHQNAVARWNLAANPSPLRYRLADSSVSSLPESVPMHRERRRAYYT